MTNPANTTENRETFFARLRPILAPSELMNVEVAYALAKHAWMVVILVAACSQPAPSRLPTALPVNSVDVRASVPNTHPSPATIEPTPIPTGVFCAGLRGSGMPELAACFVTETACTANTRITTPGIRLTPCRRTDVVYCFDYIQRYSVVTRVFCNFTLTDCNRQRSQTRGVGWSTANCEPRTDASRM